MPRLCGAVKKAAKICRHCGTDLASAPTAEGEYRGVSYRVFDREIEAEVDGGLKRFSSWGAFTRSFPRTRSERVLPIVVGGIVPAIVVIGVVAYINAHPERPSVSTTTPLNTSAGYCDRQSEGIAKALELADSLKLLPNGTNGTAKVAINEAVWESLPRESREIIGLALYCGVANSGGKTLTLVGQRDGGVKASIVDGNYSTP